MPKLRDSGRDPRLRIDIGMLVERLRRKHRSKGPSFLYGSRPPPNDSVWEAFPRNTTETNIYDRDHGGKEKEVDNSMSVGMTRNATELRVEAKYNPEAAEKKDKTTFVVVTGDRDMMPAVKSVLECNIRVELWGWKSGIAKVYLDLSANNDLLSVHWLDSIFKDICFTAYRSTRKVKGVDGGKTIVLRDVGDSDEDAICDQLLNTRQLFWKTRLDGVADLCIVFPKVSQIERLLIEARKLLPGITIVSWPEYSAPFFDNDHTDAMKTVNTYELLDLTCSAENEYGDASSEKPLEDSTPTRTIKNPSGSASGNDNTGSASGNTNTENDGGNNSDEGAWTTVQETDTGRCHRSVVNRLQDCPYGASCMKKDDCGYHHTAEERRLFQRNPNRNLGLRKTQLCRYAPNCWKGRNCLYAHTETEARCLGCSQTGHFQGDVTKCRLQT
ncbi:hypothetical protein GE09DRAFT_1160232 [Coniochaeta sp. 2T2.1]|nr:hypothetical protein GE09DRAFT_1160232 [Coniochaeta sp. 2T2.1]